MVRINHPAPDLPENRPARQINRGNIKKPTEDTSKLSQVPKVSFADLVNRGEVLSFVTNNELRSQTKQSPGKIDPFVKNLRKIEQIGKLVIRLKGQSFHVPLFYDSSQGVKEAEAAKSKCKANDQPIEQVLDKLELGFETIPACNRSGTIVDPGSNYDNGVLDLETYNYSRTISLPVHERDKLLRREADGKIGPITEKILLQTRLLDNRLSDRDSLT